MKPTDLPFVLASALAAFALPSCSSAGSVTGVDGGSDAPGDAVLPDDYVPIQKTLACTGDVTACLSGTFALKDFTAKPSATKVTLYRLYPHGDVATVAWTPVAKDGTFAFSDLAAWGHYYLQGEARFGTGNDATAVASNVGSFTVPSTPGPIPIVVRPVFLEVLQQAPSGGSTILNWASAHLYDPKSGKEVTTGTVTFMANSQSYAMPYGTNAGGLSSFNVNLPTLPTPTVGGTSFAITTSYPELTESPVTWTLVGEPATFGGAITSPTGSAPKSKALTVTWQAQPMASYSQTELFFQMGTTFVQRYVSPTVNAPDVTSETIPASALSTSGTYLINEDYANATCPPTADGCVYNLSTASVSVTVE
jgi:hypothetical protein